MEDYETNLKLSELVSVYYIIAGASSLEKDLNGRNFRGFLFGATGASRIMIMSLIQPNKEEERQFREGYEEGCRFKESFGIISSLDIKVYKN